MEFKIDKIGFITDEASVLSNYHKDKFLSPNNKSRSLLSEYTQIINKILKIDYFIYGGTSIKLIDSEEILSGAGKLKKIEIFNNIESTGENKETII
jgi:uncharacterized ubiquitin-like protein YukD